MRLVEVDVTGGVVFGSVGQWNWAGLEIVHKFGQLHLGSYAGVQLRGVFDDVRWKEMAATLLQLSVHGLRREEGVDVGECSLGEELCSLLGEFELGLLGERLGGWNWVGWDQGWWCGECGGEE